MNNKIELYELHHSDADNVGNGIWMNYNKVAIHLPQFKKSFNINISNINNIVNSFYISYNEHDNCVDLMNFDYYNLKDIVFTNNYYSFCKKANIYTTILPL